MMTNEQTAIDRAKDILTAYSGQPLRIMEVCGTHTHAIFQAGIRQLLPPALRLISGPGCPVCVTPTAFIDEAMWLATQRGVTVATYGDLVRVPGSRGSLMSARSGGADVKMFYTPLDAVRFAADHPGADVVFLSVGFETTTPASCLALQRAIELKLRNFSLLTANKTMTEAYRALAHSVDAYIYPGHVCAITGTQALTELAAHEHISGVVAGFTPSELITAIAVAVHCLEARDVPFMRNCYPRVVREDGSPAARRLMATYMAPIDTEWRGLGVIAGSGLALRDEFADYDARRRYVVPAMPASPATGCRCGEVLRGQCEPRECPLYGKACTPATPVGACMVSREGTCAAWYQYSGENLRQHRMNGCDTL